MVRLAGSGRDERYPIPALVAIVLRGVNAELFGIFALGAGVVLLPLAFLFGVCLMADGLIGLKGIVRGVRADGHWARCWLD